MTDTWSLLEADFRAVERTLLELLDRTQALAAHLVDRGGRVVLSVGPGVDYDLDSFASLAAADLAANDELMQLFGSTRVDGVACLGSHRSMASTLVADRLVLCVVFDRRSTLGLVRHRMRRAMEKLDPVFEGLFEKLGVAAGPVTRRDEPAVRVIERGSRPAERQAAVSDVPAGPEPAPEPAPEPLLPVHFGVEAAAALDDLLGGDPS